VAALVVAFLVVAALGAVAFLIVAILKTLSTVIWL
jgi:hypothetical protein